MKEISRTEISKLEFCFMEKAWELTLSSNCKEAQYGVVIAKNNLILGNGYNHTINDLLNCDKCPRRSLDVKSGVASDLCYALHGEVDAIKNAKKYHPDISLYKSKMYIGKRKDNEIKATGGKPYCTNCAKEIRLAGIEEVIFYSKNKGFLVFGSFEFLYSSYKNLIDAYEKQLKL